MTGNATIGGVAYSLSTPNDLLFSPFQRFEVQRDLGAIREYSDSDVFTVVVSWGGFSLTRHYSVPWTGSNGYAVVFPDFTGLGWRALQAAGATATVSVYFGESMSLLATGTMVVASEDGETGLHAFPFGFADCSILANWLTSSGLLCLCPVIATSRQAVRKSAGYSPAQSFSTRQGTCALYREWQEVATSVTFETVAQPMSEVDYLATFGETPFVELSEGRDIILFDSVSPASFSYADGVCSISFTCSNVRREG